MVGDIWRNEFRDVVIAATEAMEQHKGHGHGQGLSKAQGQHKDKGLGQGDQHCLPLQSLFPLDQTHPGVVTMPQMLARTTNLRTGSSSSSSSSSSVPMDTLFPLPLPDDAINHHHQPQQQPVPSQPPQHPQKQPLVPFLAPVYVPLPSDYYGDGVEDVVCVRVREGFCVRYGSIEIT